MTTQPNEAVGSGEPIAPTPEDRLAAAFGDEPEQQEDEETPETDEAPQPEEGDEPEISEEDIAEAEAALPPIDPPISWTAEEKERFNGLPRETQEFIAKRETERERFVQTKAQEAAQAQRVVSKQAAEYLAQVEQQTAEQLEWFEQQLNVSEPDPALIATNPALYAQQKRAYDHYAAQRNLAQQQRNEALQRAQQYQTVIQQQEAEEFHQRLSTELPEFFDETSGPKLKTELTATAKFLGFSDEDIFRATAPQILALKRITDVKAKAEKYDALMRKQMERVRAGKSALPPVSKPGTAKSPGAASQSQYQADREAMRRGDKAAEQRVLDAVLNQSKR